MCGGIILGKKLFISFYCFLILILGVGCGKSQPIDNNIVEQKKIAVVKDELALSIPDKIESIDPINVNNSWETQLVSNLYEGMVRYNSEAKKIEPALAKEWTISAEGNIYTFYLRDKAVFHSGKLVTADDIKNSWERAVKNQTRDTWNIFHNVNGFEQFVQGIDENLAGISVINNHTLQVSLANPDELFLLKLTHPAAAIVDIEYINDSNSGYGVVGTFEEPARVNGTGPFALVEWVAGQNITLEAFKEHPQKSQFARVDFRLASDTEMAYADLKRGYVDILRSDEKFPEILLNEAFIGQEELIDEPNACIYYLGFNVLEGPFQNQSLRQKVSFAINRSKLAAVTGARGEVDRLLPRAIVQNRSPIIEYQFSPEYAQKMFVNFEEPLKQKTTLFYVDNEINEKIAEEIQSCLKEVNLEVYLAVVTSYQELYSGVANGNINFYLDKWVPQTEEAVFLLMPFFHSKSPYNLSGYNNELVDELLDFLQNHKPFSKEYIDTVLQIERIIMTDLPMITLLEGTEYVFANQIVENPAYHPILGIQLQKLRIAQEVSY
jgi:ABC-type transport system substrate-binding protein